MAKSRVSPGRKAHLIFNTEDWYFYAKILHGSRSINIERNNLLKSTEITPLPLTTAETASVIDLWFVFHSYTQRYLFAATLPQTVFHVVF